MLPASASRHYRRIQRIQAVTITGIRRAWRRMEVRADARWEDQYRTDVGPKVVALAAAAQIAATREADTYMADVLNELAFGPETAPGIVNPTAFAGYAGDGRPIESLLATSVGRARAALSVDLTPEAALADALRFIEEVSETLVADANRAAEEVAMAVRPWVDGYVRMLNPPSCSRCALLSGKFYLFNAGFPRHPRCDCYHVPAPKKGPTLDRLLSVNSPDRYFEALTEAEQDRIFTKAGAQAIRNGADIGLVVRARRGMTTTGESRTQERLINGEMFTVNVTRRQLAPTRIGGRDVFTTTEGTTTRGRRGRTQAQRVRLMPESIFKIAGSDRDEVIRLLAVNGYIT